MLSLTLIKILMLLKMWFIFSFSPFILLTESYFIVFCQVCDCNKLLFIVCYSVNYV